MKEKKEKEEKKYRKSFDFTQQERIIKHCVQRTFTWSE